MKDVLDVYVLDPIAAMNIYIAAILGTTDTQKARRIILAIDQGIKKKRIDCLLCGKVVKTPKAKKFFVILGSKITTVSPLCPKCSKIDREKVIERATPIIKDGFNLEELRVIDVRRDLEGHA